MTGTNVPMVGKAMFDALKNNPPVLAHRFLATIVPATLQGFALNGGPPAP
jgi:hypothetical protein